MAVCAQGRGWDWGVRSGADDDQDDDDDDQDLYIIGAVCLYHVTKK